MGNGACCEAVKSNADTDLRKNTLIPQYSYRGGQPNNFIQVMPSGQDDHQGGTTSKLGWIEGNQVYPRALIGRPAPYFEATVYHQKDFKQIKLTDYLGKWVCLFFYPLDFTFVCPTEILAFADAAEEFEKNDCQIIGASIDSHFSHFQWTAQPRKKGGLGDISIPLVADTTKVISRIYGCLMTEGEHAGVANRATFIIDGKGILRHASYNDLPVGRNVDEFLRLVQALQYTDKHGEVCPAKWKPGAKAIKPDVNSETTTNYIQEQHGIKK